MIYGLRHNTIIWRLFVSHLRCIQWLSRSFPTKSYCWEPRELRTENTQTSSYLSGLTLEPLFDLKAGLFSTFTAFANTWRGPRTPVKMPRCALSPDCAPAWILRTTIALQTCSLSPLCVAQQRLLPTVGSGVWACWRYEVWVTFMDGSQQPADIIITYYKEALLLSPSTACCRHMWTAVCRTQHDISS